MLLLLLYGFIAVPVSAWHHHPQKCADAGAQSNWPAVSVGDGQWSAACKVCDHQYTPYYNNCQAPGDACPDDSPVIVTFPGHARADVPRVSFSNKGPPVIPYHAIL